MLNETMPYNWRNRGWNSEGALLEINHHCQSLASPRNTRETKPQKLADYHWCQIAGKIPPNIKLSFWHATNTGQVIFKEINILFLQ